MTTQNKRKDDELEMWAIVGGIFTLFLLVIDIFYSSVNEMSWIARVAIWLGHALISLGWIFSLAKWKDPNYDDVRKGIVALCVCLSFVIAIHHATVKDDQQVIEDANKAKQTSYLFHLNANELGLYYFASMYNDFVQYEEASYDAPLWMRGYNDGRKGNDLAILLPFAGVQIISPIQSPNGWIDKWDVESYNERRLDGLNEAWLLFVDGKFVSYL